MADTNKTAYAKGKADGRAGRVARPDFVKVGLAGSYRLGYAVGERQAKPKPRRRNGMFDADAVSRARQVTRSPKRRESPKARRTIVEAVTGQKGYLVKALPGGWLKVKWDHREKPTLIKRSELKRARNPDPKFTVYWLFSGEAKPTRYLFNNVKAKRTALAHLKKIGGKQVKAPRANPGLLDLVGGMQALDYLESKVGGGRRRNAERDMSERTQGAGATSSDVRSPTRTSTEVRSPTKTSTVADTRGNITVTGGAGAGATTRVTVKQIAARKRNPSPAEMSERFQGHATGSVKNYYASDSAPRLDYSRAGRLVFLKVNGKQLRIPGAVAAIDPRTERIWIAGAKRGAMFNKKAARKGEALDFGEVEAICYLTAKSHIGAGKRYEYVHAFGEEGGRKPRLLIDHEGMPILRGGDYRVKAEGIVN